MASSKLKEVLLLGKEGSAACVAFTTFSFSIPSVILIFRNLEKLLLGIMENLAGLS